MEAIERGRREESLFSLVSGLNVQHMTVAYIRILSLKASRVMCIVTTHKVVFDVE